MSSRPPATIDPALPVDEVFPLTFLPGVVWEGPGRGCRGGKRGAGAEEADNITPSPKRAKLSPAPLVDYTSDDEMEEESGAGGDDDEGEDQGSRDGVSAEVEEEGESVDVKEEKGESVDVEGEVEGEEDGTVEDEICRCNNCITCGLSLLTGEGRGFY